MRRHRALLLPLLLLAVLAAGCDAASATSLAAQGLERGDDGWYAEPVNRQRQLPDVVFTDTAGNQRSLRDFNGDPTLLYFGYTHCPDICPIHLAAITSSLDAVSADDGDLDVVFVSVDPERDTAERIEEYLTNFDGEIVGLRAEIDTVARALNALDLGGPVVEGADPRGEGDLIGHPAQVLGFDAEGRARRVWPFGARRSDWVSDLPRVIEEWS